MDMFVPIFAPFRDETKVLERTATGLRNAVAVRRTDCAGAPAAAASLQIESQCRQNRLRRDRHLAPLESPQSFIRAVKGDALLADRLVQTARRIGGGLHIREVAKNCSIVAHSVLYVLLDCNSLQSAVYLKWPNRVGPSVLNK